MKQKAIGGLAAVILALPRVALPCIGPPDQTPLEYRVASAFCEAEVVFIGRVGAQLRLGETAVEHELRPIWAAKGIDAGRNARPTFVLTHFCGSSLERDKSYLIFGTLDRESRRLQAIASFANSTAIREQLQKVLDTPDFCSTFEPVDSTPNRRFLREWLSLPREWQSELQETSETEERQ